MSKLSSVSTAGSSSDMPSSVDFVRFEQTDTHGISRSKFVPRRHYELFKEKGLNFIMGQLAFDPLGGIAPDTGYMSEINFADSRLLPDPETLKPVPWARNSYRVLCEPFFNDGRAAKGHPRHVARQILYKLNDMGYELVSSHEYEFYLVDKKTKDHVFDGVNIFSTVRNAFNESFISNLTYSMSLIGVDIRTVNVEYGPGQLEITYQHEKGITSADNAFTFKNGVKEIAQQAGYMASFMSKPWIDQSANGCHFNHSLISTKDGTEAFFDTKTNALSEIGQHWLAGLLHHAPAMTALLAPTVNCFKRFKDGSFAPTNITWGIQNRSTAFRVKVDGLKGTYIENRIGCGGSNPYLVLAATVAAGTDGIEKKLKLQPATDGVAYGLDSKEESGIKHLPRRLEDALEALQNDKVMCDALGPEFVKLFVAVKKHEIATCSKKIRDYSEKTFRERVDEFERHYYFEFL